MNLTELLELIQSEMKTIISEAKQVRAVEIGLDSRCGTLYVVDEGILVPLHNNKTVQYYGGFEYIKAEHITQLGQYVLYSSEAKRVESCLCHLQKDEDEENDSNDE
jgi:hypothetical protein